MRKQMFYDRVDAGEQLAHELSTRKDLKLPPEPVILGLPRGGVPVAAEIARVLEAELDVLVVRKLGVPYRPELAMGAVGEDGITVLNTKIIEHAEITAADQQEALRQQRQEVAERAIRFRPPGRGPVPLQGRTAIIVDDGVATGATAQAAGQLARARGAERIILATPVVPYQVFEHLRDDSIFDEVVCLRSPVRFRAVGAFYTDFAQVTDAQVREILGT